jgi:hypothetical protein
MRVIGSDVNAAFVNGTMDNLAHVGFTASNGDGNNTQKFYIKVVP